MSLNDQSEVVARSMTTLQTNHASFLASGGNLQNAKFHNNAIRKAILPVHLEDVCIPVLHLDLGIYPWMNEALCAEAQKIDSGLTKCPGLVLEDTDSTTFTSIVTSHQRVLNNSFQIFQELHGRMHAESSKKPDLHGSLRRREYKSP